MTAACELFIKAVLGRNWREAYTNLNGLNMEEMLRGMAALDLLDLADFWAQRSSFTSVVNLPRIEYAHETVINRKACPKAPAGLSNDQIVEAQTFAARPTPLLFEHDLTGLLPDPPATPLRLAEMDYANAARQIQSEVAGLWR